MTQPQYQLKMISFKTCPFVQKVITLLQVKQISCDVEYIDLNNKPDWFYQISPLGKVPVLIVDKTTLFESSVILDFLDEAYAPALYPADLVQKALNKAWIEFGSGLLMQTHHLLRVENEEQLEKSWAECERSLKKLEKNIVSAPFFNGKQLSVIDAAYSSLFMRLNFLEEHLIDFNLDDFPKIQQWSQAILSDFKVKQSLPADYEKLMLENMKKRNAWIIKSFKVE